MASFQRAYTTFREYTRDDVLFAESVTITFNANGPPADASNPESNPVELSEIPGGNEPADLNVYPDPEPPDAVSV
jgi:hypothetical protein